MDQILAQLPPRAQIPLDPIRAHVTPVIPAMVKPARMLMNARKVQRIRAHLPPRAQILSDLILARATQVG